MTAPGARFRSTLPTYSGLQRLASGKIGEFLELLRVRKRDQDFFLEEEVHGFFHLAGFRIYAMYHLFESAINYTDQQVCNLKRLILLPATKRDSVKNFFFWVML